MKSTLIRFSLLSFFLVLFIPKLTSAETRTFIKEYSYQASEIDSKVSSRAIALEQIKRLLLEEVGVYLESETEVKNYRLTNDQITVLTAGVVRTEMLQESWDGKIYYIQAKIEINPNEVAQSIGKLRQDRQKTKELEESRKKVIELLREIDKLKIQASSAGGTPSASNLYIETVNKLRAIELCDKAYKLRMSQTIKEEEAIELYSEAIALDPAFVVPYYYRAFTYYILGVRESRGNKDQAFTFLKKAIKDYDKVVQLNPQSFFYAAALSGRGGANQKLGDECQDIVHRKKCHDIVQSRL